VEINYSVFIPFLLTAIIPILVFGIYGIIILKYGKNIKQNKNEESKELPLVTVVIPTHNEEHIITKKIENIFNSNYPMEKLELIFVDDSTDKTNTIIAELSKNNSTIKLIHFEERKGYSPSMLIGSQAAKGEIIVLTDAHSFFDENTILNLVKNFDNPNIGAVSGTSTIMNPEGEVAKSENLYLTLYNKMRTAESNLDSTFWFKGEASAVRKNLIEDLLECNATFDTTVALYVRQKGYHSVFDPTVHFYEYAPTTHSDHVKQKTIRAANIIKILFYFKHMIFNKKYDKFGTIIYPANFFMVVLSPLFILSNIVLLIPMTIFNNDLTIYIISIYFIIITLIIIIKKSLMITFIEFTYSLLKALFQILFTKIEHDKVEKLMSTRKAP